jgi:MFS family permease
MCVVCNENGAQAQCPTCRALTGASFPLEAGAGFDQIWSYVVERFKEEWLMLSVVVLLFMFIVGVGGALSNVFSGIINAIAGLKTDPQNPFRDMRVFLITSGIGQIVGTIVQLPFQAIGTLGMLRVVMDVLYGRKADIGRMFKHMHLVGRAVLLQVLLFAIVTLPVMILFAVLGFVAVKISGAGLDFDSQWVERFMRSSAPFLIFAFSLVVIVISVFLMPLQAFSMPELLVSECDSMEALRRAWVLGDGQRLRLFGYSMLGGLLGLVGVLVCCVGAIPALAAGQMLIACLFLVIRKGSQLPAIVDK